MVPLTRSAGGVAGGAAQWLRRAVRVRRDDSPTKLRLAVAVTVVCALAMSVGGWYSIVRRQDAIREARAAAQQLIRVQDVRVLVVQADSIASNAYLAGGQESREQRARYDERIASAASRLVEVANAAAGSDVADLEQVSSQLATYVGLVEQARSNNRQGYPVGAAYQRQARSVADGLVASLRTVEQRARAQVNGSIERARRVGWLLILAGLALLGVLAAGSLWLAARWRRLINVPIAAAGVVALMVLTAGVGVSARAVSDASAAVRGALAPADLLAQARAAAFEARANEALTLIARGTGQAYETQWLLSSSVVDQALDAACERFDRGCAARTLYGQYRDAHEQVRALDDEGNWDGAVDMVTDPAIPPSATFAAFAESAEGELDADTAAATAAFDDAARPLGVLRVLVVIAGLLAGVLTVAGYGQRLREYR